MTNKIRVTASVVTLFGVIVDLAEKIPGRLLRLDSPKYVGFLAALANLRLEIERFQAQVGTDRNFQGGWLEPMLAFDSLDAISLLRREILACRDEGPGVQTTGLEFISDVSQRETLRVDLGSVETALANNEWKAATILAGSLIEALLLWAVKKRATDVPGAIAALVKRSVFMGKQAPDSSAPDNWNLFQYIRVARELNEIEQRTETIAVEVRDFRNLIHPGLSVRSGQTCTRGTAHAAYGALQLTIEDLAKRRP